MRLLLSRLVPIRFRARIKVIDRAELVSVDRFHGTHFDVVAQHHEVSSWWQWRGRTYRHRTWEERS